MVAPCARRQVGKAGTPGQFRLHSLSVIGDPDRDAVILDPDVDAYFGCLGVTSSVGKTLTDDGDDVVGQIRTQLVIDLGMGAGGDLLAQIDDSQRGSEPERSMRRGDLVAQTLDHGDGRLRVTQRVYDLTNLVDRFVDRDDGLVQTIQHRLWDGPLGGKIDALACVLPDADVRGEDRLASARETYRIQSVEEEHFFGTVTHKNLQLVKLNGR